jgi:hypothetical protein
MISSRSLALAGLGHESMTTFRPELRKRSCWLLFSSSLLGITDDPIAYRPIYPISVIWWKKGKILSRASTRRAEKEGQNRHGRQDGGYGFHGSSRPAAQLPCNNLENLGSSPGICVPGDSFRKAPIVSKSSVKLVKFYRAMAECGTLACFPPSDGVMIRALASCGHCGVHCQLPIRSLWPLTMLPWSEDLRPASIGSMAIENGRR